MVEQLGDGVPVTWAELITQKQDLTRYMVQLHQTNAAQLSELGISQELASRFGGVTLTLAQGVILLGPDFCRPALTAWLTYFPDAVHSITDTVSDNAAIAHFLLAFVNIAQCSNHPRPIGTETLEENWLPLLAQRAADLTWVAQQSMALLSVAAGLPTLVPHFLGSDRATRFLPGQTFEFNIPGFIHYLALALEHQATVDEIKPAWQSFLLSFPYKLAAQTVQWVDLLLAGKVLAQFQQMPIELVAQSIHQQITTEFV